MRPLNATLLCLLLSGRALPCESPSPTVLECKDKRVREKKYAGDFVNAYTMTLLDEGERGEYLSFLKGLNLGAFIIADMCGKGKCLDIFTDKNADGTIDDHYRIPYNRVYVLRLPLVKQVLEIQGTVKKAFSDSGTNAAVKALEDSLGEYRLPQEDLSHQQAKYTRHLEAARAIFCKQAFLLDGTDGGDRITRRKEPTDSLMKSVR